MNEHSSVYSSELMTPLRHDLLGSSELTIKERLSIFCKPSFQMRRLKNKGAVLILVWSYLCTSVLFFYLKSNGDYRGVKFLVPAAALGLTLSIAGWIADVQFGRYKVISLSMWLMWAALMMATVSTVLATVVPRYTSNIHGYVNGVLWTIVAIGFGGFQANIIQFGIDQLYDASTNEITSFILWYVWTFYGDGFMVFFVIDCLPKQYWIALDLIMCVYLSIALSSMLVFNHWLVKEPVTQNPFKLVYSVVRYAIKHKHPECRSAFTYCEDEPPSRIDFGKRKYGGPFTTEQVEDVKTFLRIIITIFVGTGIFYAIFVSLQQLERVLGLLTDTTSSSYRKCYSIEAFIESCLFGSFIILPFYELFLYPIFHRCLEMINSRWKFISGVFLLIVETVTLLIIESIARHKYFRTNSNYNTSIPCIGHSTLSTSMDFRVMAVPLLLHSLSVTAIAIGAFEFLASQAPYSMRGLIMGIVYCTLTLFAAVGLGISVPFTKQSFSWGTGIISCGFWYALQLLVIEVLIGLLLIAIRRWYKKRKREDVLPNEHIFAERYYDRDN